MSTPTINKRRSADHVTKRNKRLRKQIRATPWRDQWELESVGSVLLTVTQPYQPIQADNNKMSVQHALDIVAVWKARSDAMDPLPHAVESTATLAQVIWRDSASQFQISVTELRLAYSSAIVRCINGFADTMQQQRFTAAPISVLCGRLGIPSWLVDIRHDASHNALPTLGVLRLAASTLLDFLKSEYWIPTCPNMASDAANDKDNSKGDSKSETASTENASALLLKYKTCASGTKSTFSETVYAVRKELSTKTTKLHTSRPFDTFFGDSDNSISSSDDDDDWEDSIMGSLWGSSIGTNANRFSALEEPRKAKHDSKKRKDKTTKSSQNKKGTGEMYPVDYAKLFVKRILPLEGFGVALRFLVWGGIGGSPSGRGVLIPGSSVAFPATQQGIMKSWQRYGPLVKVLGRSWPGFCPALVVHLVDFVLSIEAVVVGQSEMDAGSARKLFFLSAWVRLLLSQQFVSGLKPEFSQRSAKRNSKNTELLLANRAHLEQLQYPLNSLCERCDENTGHSELRKTSQDIFQSLEEILGVHRVRDFRVVIPEPISTCQPAPSTHGDGKFPVDASQNREEMSSENNAGILSLEDLEAMLSDDLTNTAVHKHKELKNQSVPDFSELEGQSHEHAEHAFGQQINAKSCEAQQPPRRRGWVRCTSWDPCAIGTLPGYPV